MTMRKHELPAASTERKQTQTPAKAGNEQGNNDEGHGQRPSGHRLKPDQEPSRVTAAKQGGVSDGQRQVSGANQALQRGDIGHTGRAF